MWPPPPEFRHWTSSSWFPVNWILDVWKNIFLYQQKVERGNSSIAFMVLNLSTSTQKDECTFAPQYKITSISGHILTSLYFSALPHHYRTPSGFLSTHFYGLPYCDHTVLHTHGLGEAKIGAPRNTYKAQVSDKNEFSLDMREVCIWLLPGITVGASELLLLAHARYAVSSL